MKGHSGHHQAYGIQEYLHQWLYGHAKGVGRQQLQLIGVFVHLFIGVLIYLFIGVLV